MLKSRDCAELESDSGTEEEGSGEVAGEGGRWVIFPKEVPFQEAHEGESSFPFLFACPCPCLVQPQEVGDP